MTSSLFNSTINFNGVILSPVTSARNLGVILDKKFSFSQCISSVSKTCFQHILGLRRIRNTNDHTTACTIATSLIYSKVNYYNSLFLNHPSKKIATTGSQCCCSCCHQTPNLHHISSILKSLHWLNINHRIE